MRNKINFLKIFILALGITGFAYGADIRELNEKQQKIVSISAFTARGELPKLETSLNEGLNSGLTINEIKEVLVHLYAYCGFPRSLNGLNTFMRVLEDRKAKNINDTVGRESSPIPADRNSVAYGTDVQSQITGGTVTGAVYAFAPDIDLYLKGHLFGDIFGRDVLDYQSRELATVGALASMYEVNPQLQAHFKNGMNTGLTENQMRDVVEIIREKVGENEGNNAEMVLNRYLEIR